MIYDLTPPISPELGVWPGDTPASREVLLDLQRGDSVTLSTIRATVHLGAHADAPSHYSATAPTIESRDLHYYLGPAQVVRAPTPRRARLDVAGFCAATASQEQLAPRVLIALDSFPAPQQWNNDFASIEPSLVDYLHERGVILIGLDSPSVDAFESKDLFAHQRFLAHDMAILEGLVLRGVPAGRYELIALPLPLVGFDASPVRAILRSQPV